MTSSKTFRFNVSGVLNDKMIEFAALHKFEERKVLKENFENWLELQEIQELIETEEAILRRNDYDLSKTSIQSKIFKSIKYYHIKNMMKEMQMTSDVSNDSSNIKENRGSKNIVFCKSFIELAKDYLHQNISDPDFKPSSCFTEFKNAHSADIQIEYERIKEKYENNDIDITIETLDFKLKKMFKNQYFTLFKAAKKA